MPSVLKAFRGLWGRLNSLAHLDRRVNESTHASSVAAARLEVLSRELRLLARQATLPPAHAWKGGPTPNVGLAEPAEPATMRSTLCRQESFETEWFAAWLKRLGHGPRYHRKLWEFCFICQALKERGSIRPGAKGLGFGVGNEPLSAYFASQDCKIVATDLPPDHSAASQWSETGQYASGKDALRMPVVCPDELFDRNVQFRWCDMNAVPADLVGFDFCWSACALEHLGTLAAGATFVERSLDCLVPGGVAVHTTEFNLSSNSETLVSGPTVLYRRRDLEDLANRIQARGCLVVPFDFDHGIGVLDEYIDFPPYLNEPHLRLSIEGFATTSVAIIIEKPAHAA